jgi:hypothetical protein
VFDGLLLFSIKSFAKLLSLLFLLASIEEVFFKESTYVKKNLATSPILSEFIDTILQFFKLRSLTFFVLLNSLSGDTDFEIISKRLSFLKNTDCILSNLIINFLKWILQTDLFKST